MTDIKFYDLAISDLSAAKQLYQTGHYSQAIFFLQQSVEKALKGMGLATKMVTFDQLSTRSIGHNAFRIFKFGINSMKEKASTLLEIGETHPSIFEGIGLPKKEIKKYHTQLLKEEGKLSSTQTVDYFDMSYEDFEELFNNFEETTSERIEIPSDEFLPFMVNHFERMVGNGLLSQDEASEAIIELSKPGLADALLLGFSKGIEIEIWLNYVLYPLSVITSAHESESRYPCDHCGHHPLDHYCLELPLVDRFMDLADWHSKCLTKLEPLFEKTEDTSSTPVSNLPNSAS